jgi:multicomponent Na+:H+ antiporter subunit D
MAIAVPILGACLLLACGRLLPTAVIDVFATGVALLECGIVAVLLHSAATGRVVDWVGGWHPANGFSVGIVLVADRVAAGVALLAAVLVVVALVYGWRYFDEIDAHYHPLLLLFLAGMVGFALSGDLFDMFVFFELMGAAAYALTGLRVEEPTAVQGALNFGVINSLGAYVSLLGIGLLYSRTGNLTLPQLHEALAGRPADRLVAVAFVAILIGLLVKAAVVPFHFWLDDAHAVAPTPVCVLFSGVMVPLGAYAAFRVYWMVFAGSIPAADAHRMFLTLGVVTALLGSVMCFAQRHLKRLLAYSTIAHVGLFTVAAGTLSSAGAAGALVYVLAHATIKGALFLIAGVVLNRYGSLDEARLHGCGRTSPRLRWVAVLGALALAGLPPFGTGLGKSLSEDAGLASGYEWVPVLFVIVSAVTGGAVLRAAGCIFFGLGDAPTDGGEVGEEQPEQRLTGRLPATMAAPIVALVLAGLALGVAPGVHAVAEQAGAGFVDASAYARAALTGAGSAPALPDDADWTSSGVLLDLLSAALAAALATLAWYGHRVAVLPAIARGFSTALGPVRRLHSGHLGDYVAWLVLGALALTLLVGVPNL